MDLIREGIKDQTCRPLNTAVPFYERNSRVFQLANARKYELYFKSRAPVGYKIGEGFRKDFFFVAFAAHDVVKIRIKESLVQPGPHEIPEYDWRFEPVEKLACEDFAIRDGFENYQEMKNFFKAAYGPQAIGKMIFMVPRWDFDQNWETPKRQSQILLPRGN